MNPTFSIIIPCYNVSSYIDEAIESCLSQININANDFEIIAINDGSTDDTYSKLLKYSEYPNVTILTQENAGLSRTRNRGIDLAKGDYILFLDGDDWFSPNALYVLNQHLNDADIVLFPMEFYFGPNNRRNESLGLKHRYIYDVNELLRETIGKSQFQACPAQAKCYKTKLLRNNSQYFINDILHEDGPFFLETLYNASSVKYIEEYIYHYRLLRQGSITTKKRTWRNAEGIFKGNERVRSLYGYKNKDVNYYLLATSVMQLFQAYENESEAKKVVEYMSASDFKICMIKSLAYFRFNLRTFLLGLLAICSPKLARKIYALKH